MLRRTVGLGETDDLGGGGRGQQRENEKGNGNYRHYKMSSVGANGKRNGQDDFDTRFRWPLLNFAAARRCALIVSCLVLNRKHDKKPKRNGRRLFLVRQQSSAEMTLRRCSRL